MREQAKAWSTRGLALIPVGVASGREKRVCRNGRMQQVGVLAAFLVNRRVKTGKERGVRGSKGGAQGRGIKVARAAREPVREP